MKILKNFTRGLGLVFGWLGMSVFMMNMMEDTLITGGPVSPGTTGDTSVLTVTICFSMAFIGSLMFYFTSAKKDRKEIKFIPIASGVILFLLIAGQYFFSPTCNDKHSNGGMETCQLDDE